MPSLIKVQNSNASYKSCVLETEFEPCCMIQSIAFLRGSLIRSRFQNVLASTRHRLTRLFMSLID
jgi:hypothetical protein